MNEQVLKNLQALENVRHRAPVRMAGGRRLMRQAKKNSLSKWVSCEITSTKTRDKTTHRTTSAKRRRKSLIGNQFVVTVDFGCLSIPICYFNFKM